MRMFVSMKQLFLFLAGLLGSVPAWSQDFDRDFEDATLRLDYVLCGDAHHQAIYFQQAYRTSRWAGRRSNLSEPLLAGNGQVRVLDPETGAALYANSFSTLFQEWQSYEEASRVQRAFENCFQVPFPRRPVDIELYLTDVHGEVTARLRHRIDPSDILVRKVHDNGLSRAVLWQGGGLDRSVDIAILAEGYAEADKAQFYADARRAVRALLGHEPFRSRQDRFNFTAVFAPSQDSGVSVPHEDAWRNTVASSHFDTFYSERYLTTSSMRKVYDALGTIPFEHIIVLANTAIYGGGGIYNSVTIMNSGHPTFDAVLVHEFGHAFGGLGDEYFYDDMYSSMYPSDTEPWEPNLTTLKDFDAKWKDMLPVRTAVPTPVDDLEKQDVRRVWNTFTPAQKAQLNLKVGVYEGGGYQSRGVYRPVQECRMKINECEEFCPVCSRAITRMIGYYTE